jgi:hypothetical protein
MSDSSDNHGKWYETQLSILMGILELMLELRKKGDEK